jgi:hypothetical protein
VVSIKAFDSSTSQAQRANNTSAVLLTTYDYHNTIQAMTTPGLGSWLRGGCVRAKRDSTGTPNTPSTPNHVTNRELSPLSVSKIESSKNDIKPETVSEEQRPVDQSYFSPASALMAMTANLAKPDVTGEILGTQEAQDVPKSDDAFYTHIEEILASAEPVLVAPTERMSPRPLASRDGSPSPLSSVPPSPSEAASSDTLHTIDDTTDVDEIATNSATGSAHNDTPFKNQIKDALNNIKSATSKRTSKRKARSTPLPTGPSKRAKRDRNAEASAEVMKLPYQSIVSINMPPRPGLPSTPKTVIPEPDPFNLPFGPTEDYHNSMIIHYLDELCVTYTRAAELYSMKFPNDAITDEAIRKRHIRCLLRLWKKYGLKSEKEIEALRDIVPANVRKRGIKRAKSLKHVQKDETFTGMTTPFNGSGGEDDAVQDEALPDQTLATIVRLPAHLKRKHTSRDFEKACIVVWRDAEKLTWKQIRDKLEEERGWSLGLGTIEKYYYLAINRVHGRGEVGGGDAEGEGEEGGMEEGVEGAEENEDGGMNEAHKIEER